MLEITCSFNEYDITKPVLASLEQIEKRKRWPHNAELFYLYQPWSLDEAFKTVLLLSEVMYPHHIFAGPAILQNPSLQALAILQVMYSHCKIADLQVCK